MTSTMTFLSDDEFLKQLVEEAKLYGWDGDYTEVRWFVEAVFRRRGKQPPRPDELEPYS